MTSKESQRKWWARLDPERKRAKVDRMRIYHAAHKEESNQKRRAHYYRNRPTQLARSIERQRRLWYTPEERARRKANKARHASRLQSSKPLTHSQWVEILAAHDNRCAYCEKPLDGRPTQDHIIPVSKGGEHTTNNVVPACITCNRCKSAKDVFVFMKELAANV